MGSTARHPLPASDSAWFQFKPDRGEGGRVFFPLLPLPQFFIACLIIFFPLKLLTLSQRNCPKSFPGGQEELFIATLRGTVQGCPPTLAQAKSDSLIVYPATVPIPDQSCGMEGAVAARAGEPKGMSQVAEGLKDVLMQKTMLRVLGTSWCPHRKPCKGVEGRAEAT